MAKLKIRRKNELASEERQFFNDINWVRAIRYSDLKASKELIELELHRSVKGGSYWGSINNYYDKYGTKMALPAYARIIRNHICSNGKDLQAISEADVIKDAYKIMELRGAKDNF